MPKNTEGRINDKWQSFVKALNLKNFSAIQQQEMRRAFYAGAEAFLSCTLEVSAYDEDRAALELDMMDQELKSFARFLKDGHA